MPTLLTPGPSPQPVVLEGRSVRIRPLDIATDAAPLFEAMRTDLDRIYRFLPVPPPADVATLAAQLAEWQSRADTLQFLFEDRNGRPAGTSSFMRIAPEHRVLEVGFVVMAPWAQRSTLATEAQFLLARHVFENLGYRRYEWKCDDRNTASSAAAERFGFRYEGTFRAHMIVKGESRDTAWFAMTDADWPAVKCGFERWLAPTNFDPAGRQRLSLAALRVPD
jgi:RimJ/RimL family protein N-acetyltransferase